MNSKLTKKIKKIVKPVQEELATEVKKLPKELASQATGKQENQTSPIVEAVSQGVKELSPQEKQQREIEMKRNVARLEEEMQKAKVERTQKEKEWEENQEEVFSKPGEPVDSVLIMPTSKPSRGDPKGGQKKSMETRKSKH